MQRHSLARVVTLGSAQLCGLSLGDASLERKMGSVCDTNSANTAGMQLKPELRTAADDRL